MAVTTALIEGQRATQGNIASLALRSLLSVWQSLDLADAQSATRALLPAAEQITGAYGELAATTAADFYDDARAAAGPPGSFRAAAARPAPAGQVDAMVRWAATPLWSRDANAALALSKLAGGMVRLTVQPARDTIWESTRRDRARYAVVPASSACDWCLMLASRGGVYHTEQTGRVSVEAGRDYHDHCNCAVVPVWRDPDLPDVNRRLADLWAEHASAAPNPRAAWRDAVERGVVTV